VSSAFTAATNGWGLFIGPYGGATFAVKVRFAHSCVESSPPSIVQTWAGEHSDDACPGGHQYVCHVGVPSLQVQQIDTIGICQRSDAKTNVDSKMMFDGVVPRVRS
jgi:hypothetical protein